MTPPLLNDHDIVFNIPSAIGMAADTSLWLRPVQYERTARAEGNALKIDKLIAMLLGR